MESIVTAVRQLEKIGNWTCGPLEPVVALAEVDCLQVLTAVAARMRCRETTAATGRGPYARLESALSDAHELYVLNAEHRGIISRVCHRVSDDAAYSVARNHRGAYETALILACLDVRAERPHKAGIRLGAAKREIVLYAAEVPRSHPVPASPREPMALAMYMEIHKQASAAFAADLARLRRLFSGICEQLMAQ